MMKTVTRIVLLLLAVYPLCRAHGETVSQPATRLQVAGDVDVVVAGGSIRAVGAAPAAARNGASVFLLTDRPYLGEDLCADLRLFRDGASGTENNRWLFPDGEKTTPLHVKTTLDRKLLAAGVKFLTGSYPAEVVTDEKGRFAGITMANRSGRRLVKAAVLVDATRHAVPARRAGIPFTPFEAGTYDFTMRVIGGDLVTGTQHLTGKKLGVRLTTRDHYGKRGGYEGGPKNVYEYRYTARLDADTWRELCRVEQAFRDLIMVDGIVDSRERRRVVSDYMLKTTDILAGRTFADTVFRMRSNFDAAAFPSTELFFVKDMKGPAFTCTVPYRCFLPRGLSGIIAVGLGAGIERDAMTLTRMQADLQNQGYGMGIAAAMAAGIGGDTRAIDITALQRKLIAAGVMPPACAEHEDSFPVPERAVKEAVDRIAGLKRGIDNDRNPGAKTIAAYRSLAIVLTHPEAGLPLLRAGYKNAADPDARANYAKTLAVMGDETGLTLLVEEVKSTPWDAGFGWSARRETHNTYAEVDRLVIALGCIDGPGIERVLLKKARALKPESGYSHYRALACALNRHASGVFREPLADLLTAFGDADLVRTWGDLYTRRAVPPRKRAGKFHKTDGVDDFNAAMKELVTAGMLYTCGDRDGRGRAVLEQYRNDIHGHLARYARAFLERKEANQ